MHTRVRAVNDGFTRYDAKCPIYKVVLARKVGLLLEGKKGRWHCASMMLYELSDDGLMSNSNIVGRDT
jgi:hypothetical protein